MPPRSRAAKSGRESENLNESKRLANRLAQRKFREQQRTHLQTLEKELALCQAGTSTELLERRRECKRLREDRNELRELLRTVAEAVERYTRSPEPRHDNGSSDETCESDSAAQPIQTQLLHDSAVTNISAHSTSSLDDDIAEAHAHSTRIEDDIRAWIPTEGDFHIGHFDDLVESPERSCPDVLWPELTSTTIPSISQHPHQQQDFSSANVGTSADDSASIPHLWRSLDDATSLEMTSSYKAIPQMALGSDSAAGLVQDSRPSWGSGADVTLHPVQGRPGHLSDVDTHHLADLSPNPLHLRSLSVYSGQPATIPPAWSERIDLLHVLLQRNLSQLLHDYRRRGNLSRSNLFQIDNDLSRGITEIVHQCNKNAFHAMNFTEYAMYGGSAWIVWQLVKSVFVQPALRELGVSWDACPEDELPPLFQKTLPAWLRPTDLQRSIR